MCIDAGTGIFQERGTRTGDHSNRAAGEKTRKPSFAGTGAGRHLVMRHVTASNHYIF